MNDYQEQMFLRTVNTEKGGPIVRQVTRMVRLKARDYNSENKNATKEYLIFYENWYGKNWLEEDIAPVSDHIEGLYFEQEKRTNVDRDMKTGRTSTKYKRTGQCFGIKMFNLVEFEAVPAGHWAVRIMVRKLRLTAKRCGNLLL